MKIIIFYEFFLVIFVYLIINHRCFCVCTRLRMVLMHRFGLEWKFKCCNRRDTVIRINFLFVSSLFISPKLFENNKQGTRERDSDSSSCSQVTLSSRLKTRLLQSSKEDGGCTDMQLVGVQETARVRIRGRKDIGLKDRNCNAWIFHGWAVAQCGGDYVSYVTASTRPQKGCKVEGVTTLGREGEIPEVGWTFPIYGAFPPS